MDSSQTDEVPISASFGFEALFLFNVFFPMYPADGAKLLVWAPINIAKAAF